MATNFQGAQFSLDWRFKIFCENNFHGPRIPLESIRYSKFSRSLIFEVQCQSTKNAENDAPLKFGAVRYCATAVHQHPVLCIRAAHIPYSMQYFCDLKYAFDGKEARFPPPRLPLQLSSIAHPWPHK